MDLIVILNLAPAVLIIIPVPLFPALHPLPLLLQLLLASYSVKRQIDSLKGMKYPY